jgi:CubicO group peptidase (beta-lactamase class C family)
MRAARPERGSHPPGTFWYYNNWDFNALGTIFQQETGRDIFEDFNRKIARRIGMQDFEAAHCAYEWEQQYSIHPCYTFWMSARDRARFGQLFLQQGRWGERQVVPKAWVEESTRSHSETGDPGAGYGYMWWTLSREFFADNTSDRRLHHLSGFTASGYRGQWILVLPDAEMVISTAVDVPAGGNLEGDEFGPLLEMILTAREIVDLKVRKARVREETASAGQTLHLMAKVKNRSETPTLATTVDFYLSSVDRSGEDDYWLGNAPLAQLSSGRAKSARLAVPVPSNLAPGRYRLIAFADEDKTNYDLWRENNIKIARSVIEIR